MTFTETVLASDGSFMTGQVVVTGKRMITIDATTSPGGSLGVPLPFAFGTVVAVYLTSDDLCDITFDDTGHDNTNPVFQMNNPATPSPGVYQWHNQSFIASPFVEDNLQMIIDDGDGARGVHVVCNILFSS